jgi:hypothetical protein
MRALCRVERAWMMITIMKFDWMEDRGRHEVVGATVLARLGNQLIHFLLSCFFSCIIYLGAGWLVGGAVLVFLR